MLKTGETKSWTQRRSENVIATRCLSWSATLSTSHRISDLKSVCNQLHDTEILSPTGNEHWNSMTIRKVTCYNSLNVSRVFSDVQTSVKITSDIRGVAARSSKPQRIRMHLFWANGTSFVPKEDALPSSRAVAAETEPFESFLKRLCFRRCTV